MPTTVVMTAVTQGLKARTAGSHSKLDCTKFLVFLQTRSRRRAIYTSNAAVVNCYEPSGVRSYSEAP